MGAAGSTAGSQPGPKQPRPPVTMLTTACATRHLCHSLWSPTPCFTFFTATMYAINPRSRSQKFKKHVSTVWLQSMKERLPRPDGRGHMGCGDWWQIGCSASEVQSLAA